MYWGVLGSAECIGEYWGGLSVLGSTGEDLVYWGVLGTTECIGEYWRGLSVLGSTGED